MFENVTYSFYTEVLGRSAVPEDQFNLLAVENELFIKTLINDGIVKEREENGIDSAVCRMIEIDYLTEQAISGAANENGGSVASESINGYSYSYDKTAQQEAVKLNAKSAVQQKINVIKLYNDWFAGVC
ncbi:MAG: hypothetical protein MJ196_06120 [Treponemataceae bacterium]|nr:hypothetical protein [Treponemataceae bacterium]